MAALCPLAGCGSPATTSATARATVTATATATLAPTPTPTATATAGGFTAFTCPTTVSADGTTKTFSDAQLGFSFSYPAAWTEQTCQQSAASSIFIGNLFSVFVTPRQGRTIAQWVDATKTPEETVKLTPLTDSHAVEAAMVAVTFPNGYGSTPVDAQPFVASDAIIAGTQSFYNIIGLVALVNMTDTAPPLSRVQLAQQIVPTFTAS